TAVTGSLAVVDLAEVADTRLTRRSSSDPEVDRVLGGGWVAGSAVLLAGEPGIGKSTLLLQLARNLAAAGSSVLYVAGEESTSQVRLRAVRLGNTTGLSLNRETDARRIAEYLLAKAPALVIVDSIQTLVAEDGPV